MQSSGRLRVFEEYLLCPNILYHCHILSMSIMMQSSLHNLLDYGYVCYAIDDVKGEVISLDAGFQIPPARLLTLNYVHRAH